MSELAHIFSLFYLDFTSKPISMKKHFTRIYGLLLLAILVAGCQQDTSHNPDNQATEEDDRDMGGLKLERGLAITSGDLDPGYVLYNPNNSASTYLVNRKGEVVHEWKGNFGSILCYLTDSGSVVRSAFDPDYPKFYGGGASGRIQQFNWEGDMLWDMEIATEENLSHHDIALMPNGNVLAIAWEAKTEEEVLAAGRDPEYTPKDGLWPDKIIEIEPTRPRGGKVVWEWHIWDHLIQDRDPDLPNYGNTSEHPELMDINASAHKPEPIHPDSLLALRRAGRTHRNRTAHSDGCDVYHINAINYNAELDQIVLSSPEMGEIFIIDHGTTTEEAAGHTGGRWGKGGDLLYRWGNPQNYQRGDSIDQRLFYQHDVRWVEKGQPGEGNLTVYNNNIPGGPPDSLNYSAIFEITPPTDREGNYIIPEHEAIGPDEPVWSYVAPDTISFYSSYISGAHRMENGNTFINCGSAGRMFEVTPEGEIVWEFRSPFRGNITLPNGDPRRPGNNPYAVFRSTFIPADHPALADKELVPLDPQPEVYVHQIEEEG